MLFGRRKRQKLNITLCSGYEKGGFKNFDLRNKITSIQNSWVKRLFKDDFLD